MTRIIQSILLTFTHLNSSECTKSTTYKSSHIFIYLMFDIPEKSSLLKVGHWTGINLYNKKAGYQFNLNSLKT